MATAYGIRRMLRGYGVRGTRCTNACDINFLLWPSPARVSTSVCQLSFANSRKYCYSADPSPFYGHRAVIFAAAPGFDTGQPGAVQSIQQTIVAFVMKLTFG